MADIDLCPRCQAPLKANGAASCQCGWKKRARGRLEAPEPEWVSCAHMACGTRASVRVKTKTGWANLCRQHYDHKILEEAKAYTRDAGLNTITDMQVFCGERMGYVGKSVKPVVREPGEDWEEVSA